MGRKKVQKDTSKFNANVIVVRFNDFKDWMDTNGVFHRCAIFTVDDENNELFRAEVEIRRSDNEQLQHKIYKWNADTNKWNEVNDEKKCNDIIDAVRTFVINLRELASGKGIDYCS